MKNKFLLCACAVALVSALLTSCRQKTDFDAICDTVSEQSIEGLFSGAVPDHQKLVLDVVQYRFNEDGTAERTSMSLGDGVYKAPVTTKYSSWKLGEYGTENMSRYIYVTPEAGGEAVRWTFEMGGINSPDQPYAGDKNDKVKDIEATQAALSGKNWYGNDTTFFKIDTVINVTKYDTVWTYVRKIDPETGKPMKDSAGHVIYERTIDSIKTTIVPTKMKWPVAPKTINIRSLELYRDSVTFVNTGKWYLSCREYEMNAKRETTLIVDTLSAYDFHWAFAGYSSASSFIIRARQDDQTQEYFDIKYDSKLPSITVDKQLLKIKE